MKLDMFLRKSYVLTLLLVFIFLSMQTGCCPVIKGWSQESFRRPDFTRDTLDQEGLALLPVIILKRRYACSTGKNMKITKLLSLPDIHPTHCI